MHVHRGDHTNECIVSYECIYYNNNAGALRRMLHGLDLVLLRSTTKIMYIIISGVESFGTATNTRRRRVVIIIAIGHTLCGLE